jgi:hypothetical protein
MQKMTQLAALAFLLTILAVPALTTEASAACYDSFGFPCKGGGNYSGAPGPLVAGGLPFLAVAGGAYWAVRRYRRKKK